MITAKRPDGISLHDLSLVTGKPFNSIRAYLARDQLPFDRDKGTLALRKVYTGQHAVAIAATDLIVENQKVAWPIAAERVLTSNAVDEYFGRMLSGEAAKEVWLASWSEWDFEPIKILISGSCPVIGREGMARFVERDGLVSLSFLRMQDAYERARETALQNGWILSGSQLFRAGEVS